MKKILCYGFLTFFCFCLCLHLFSCDVREKYPFLHSTDKISEINIVTVAFDKESELTEERLVEINDKDEFIENFRKMNCYVWFGDPVGIRTNENNETLLKICYTNGDFEYINWCGSAEYLASKDAYRDYVGYNVFDEETFKNFLDGYIED